MKIGIIKYRKYEERVLLNQHFSIDALFEIILEDEDFVWFNILDEGSNILMSTRFSDTEKSAKYIEVATKVKKEVEVLGTSYDAYKTPSYSQRTKTTWRVGSYTFKRKKEAQGYVDQTNHSAKLAIERLIKEE